MKKGKDGAECPVFLCEKLLIPESSLYVFSQVLGVPSAVMMDRLKYLGLPYYKDLSRKGD